MDNTFFSIPENKKAQVAEGIVNFSGSRTAEIDESTPLQGVLDSAIGGYIIPCGLMLARHGKSAFIGHGGTLPGYTAQFSIEQHNVYAIILLRNYNRSKTNFPLGSRKLLYKLSKG